MDSLAGMVPDFADREALTFLVLGDAGRGSETQRAIGAIMVDVCRQRGCDFAIGLGDNIYPAGVDGIDDDDFVKKFEEPYAGLGPFPFWMTLGNHDWLGDAQAQIDYTLHSERWRMPAPSYAIPGLPTWLRLVAFDTQTVRTDSSLADRQRDRMLESLCASSGWGLVFGHHPAGSSGVHGGDMDVNNYVDSLDALCGVDFFFAGHDHDQELLTLGRYEQVVEGAAATVRTVDPRSNSIFAVDEPGFAIVEVTQSRVTLSFYVESSAGGQGREAHRWTTGR